MNAFIRKRNKNYVVYLEFEDEKTGKRKQKIWVLLIKKGKQVKD
ncbi:hypothetical protein PCZ31_2465 [Clostridioides difficile]|nr:hypothetical protein PCZ31_2465 [Clostridioides difficile]